MNLFSFFHNFFEMEAYIQFMETSIEKQPTDPITLEDFKYSEKDHPRSIINIRRSNEIPYPYSVPTMTAMISRGQLYDPVTREPLSELAIKRIALYNESLQMFPSYSLDTHDLYQRWLLCRRPDIKLSPKQIDCIRLEAYCFLQAENLLGLFQTFAGKGSMLNRQEAEKYLRETGKKWILRTSSLIDTEYNKGYCLSIIKDDRIHHNAIVHKIGDGFYFNVGIERGQKIENVFTYEKAYPTIIHLLEDQIEL